MRPEHRRWLVLAAFIGLGWAVFALLHYSSTPPKRRPPQDRGRPVRVLELKPLPVVPRATGYGVVTAQRNWQAVAQVSGAIVELGEGVEVGRIVQEGTRLFRIDPGNYRLEQSRTQATVQAVRAQIEELKIRETSTRNSLEVEKKALELARKELDRTLALYENDLTSMAQVETAERGLLTAEKAVRQLENTLLELPASRRVLEAQLAQQQAGVEGARIDLGRTEVVAPFTMRIREVNVSLHQAVSTGQILLVGDGIDVLEVPARLPIGSVGPLLGRRTRPAQGVQEASGPTPPPEGTATDSTAAGASGTPAPEAPTADIRAAGAESPPEGKTPSEGSEKMPSEGSAAGSEGPSSGTPARRSRLSSLSALIHLRQQGRHSTWPGTVRRFEGVDPTTRTQGVVVEIDPRQPGSGRRLSTGLHVEVELRGPEREGCLAVPRSALRRDEVWVVDAENRLQRRAVEPELVQEKFVCLGGAVAPGDLVVLTDLSPAVDGMLLVPRRDETAAAWLAEITRGEADEP